MKKLSKPIKGRIMFDVIATMNLVFVIVMYRIFAKPKMVFADLEGMVKYVNEFHNYVQWSRSLIIASIIVMVFTILVQIVSYKLSVKKRYYLEDGAN